MFKNRQDIIDFLKTQEKELRANDLISVYRHISPASAPYLTKFFLDGGFDPLKYLSIVPPQYAYDLREYFNNEITLPNHIEAVDIYAFSGTYAIRLNIPSSVYYIREGAFESMPILERLYIDGCPKIDKDAFYGCYELKNIRINCTEEEWYKQNPDTIKDAPSLEPWPIVFKDAPKDAVIQFKGHFGTVKTS